MCSHPTCWPVLVLGCRYRTIFSKSLWSGGLTVALVVAVVVVICCDDCCCCGRPTLHRMQTDGWTLLHTCTPRPERRRPPCNQCGEQLGIGAEYVGAVAFPVALAHGPCLPPAGDCITIACVRITLLAKKSVLCLMFQFIGWLLGERHNTPSINTNTTPTHPE